jgi:hypothetical protein
MTVLAFLLIDWEKWRPENLFGGQILERTPAGLSLVYLGGTVLMVLILLLSFARNRRKKFEFEKNLPKEVSRRLGSTATNRSLRKWQVVFIALALFVYGFHVYWGLFAEKDNQRFQELSTRDLRYRRSTSSQLRGWMLDRSGKYDKALAYYKRSGNGTIDRTYALDREMSYFLGTEIGSPGLERTLYKHAADPMPEAWDVLTKVKKPEEEQKDVRITIDRDLQSYLAQLLEVQSKLGRKGAIVVINPQTGDVLGLYSTPSFLMSQIKGEADLARLERDKRDEPLLSRATRQFYVPGSTFKTFTMISAYRAGKDGTMFQSFPNGYYPVQGMRPIVDATQSYHADSKTVSGGCDGGCEEKDIRRAYTVSSNQYFGQMAVLLGRQRLKETAAAVGIAAVDTPKETGTQGYYPDIWNVSNRRIAVALAPARPVIVTGTVINDFDIATEGYGQGYAAQMTPFQMALIASIPANAKGYLMKPKIEADLAPQPFSQVVSPQQAAYIRETMAGVTNEPGGTAVAVFRSLDKDIRVGGKTGTAEKSGVPDFNADGTRKTVKARRRVNGEWVEYQKPVTHKRTDSWFICIAPLGTETAPEIPQLAIAVVIEGGGFGAKTAAPIVVQVIKKARELGLLGDKYTPKSTPATAPKKPKGR